MSQKSLEDMANDMFTTDSEEVIKNQLPRIEDWFDVTDGDIRFLIDTDDLNKKEKYFSYLLAAFVADLADERDGKFVKHQEADDYFGWSKDTAKSKASDYSEYIETEDGEKAVAEHRVKDIIDEIGADKE
ncbi:MAG: hypothetical protein ABEJ95_03415 [Candidatus Nanohalobium sp.]